jgi:hypothetical protein
LALRGQELDLRPRLRRTITTRETRPVEGPGGGKVLIRRVEEAFDAIPDSITLTAP